MFIHPDFTDSVYILGLLNMYAYKINLVLFKPQLFVVWYKLCMTIAYLIRSMIPANESH